MKKLDANQVSDIIALSSMQEGMLFHYLKEPGSTLYFEQVSLHIASRVDLSAFEAAWQHVVSSNEMLRAVFRWEGVKEPVQIVLKERSPFLQIIDASSQRIDERSAFIAKAMDDDRNTPFDLTEGAFRVCLYPFAAADYQMILSHHHILFDGWSTGIILNEFMEAYQLFLNQQQPSAAPKKRYKEFIGLTRSKDKAEQEKFWTGYLQDVQPVWLQDILPASPSRNQTEGNKQLRMELPLFLYEEIKQEGKYSVSCYLYAAWALLQAFYTDSRDIVFGTTISGREEGLHGWEETVGLFINTLPLRLKIDPEETFKGLLEKVFASLNARQQYGSTPLRDIKRYSGMPFEKELFDTILVIENYPLQNNLNSRNMLIDSFSYREETNYPLSISITLWNSIEFVADYNSRLYSEAFIHEAASRYQLILSSLVQHQAAPVASADFLFPEEQRKLLQEFTDTAAVVPADKTIHQLFEEQADKEPDRVGLHYAGQTYTYRQLNEQANQLANFLIDKGIKPNQLLGICMDRRPELLIAMLGILKSGGAYVPVDPILPEERIAAMVQDGQIQVIITVQKYTDALMGMNGKQPVRHTLLSIDQDVLQGHYGLQDIGQYPHEAGIHPSTPEDLAYVIYTSGSTGTPKGVMVSHGNVVNFIFGMDKRIGFRPDDKVLALTTYSFDIFVLESLLPLCLGMNLVLAADWVQKDPDAILRLIEQESIDILQATPSRMRMLVESSLAGCLQQPGKILIGGEGFPEDLYQSLRKITDQQIYNVYGPTETTVWSTVQELEDTLSIGQPIANTGIYILSKDKHLRPLGYPGELCISGKGVAQGYLNQPGLTSEKFINNPYHPEERLYCTGDYAYWLPDGRLQFVGRNDGQVKIRGHRIEIAGIESTIKSYPAVKDVVVIEVKEAGGAALAAYLVTGGGFVLEDFQTFLKSKLPYYAVPAYLYEIDEIPYTSNLKVDRKALAHMKTGRMVQPGKLVEPRSKLENEVAEIWRKVLKTERVGIFNRFFDIGGDSVKVIHLCNELKARLNMEIPVQTIFDYPTIHEFVSYCNETMKKTTGEARQQPEEPKAFEPPTIDFQDTDVAIIGMAGRFPGAADKEQFWSNLVSGKEAIKFYTDEELKALGMDSELLNNPKYVKAKGKLDDSDCFDADFFGYTVAEAKWMDPQIRLLHECAWHALEDAGYEPESYPGAIGLYIGSSYNIYWVPEKFSPSLYASDQYQIYNMNSNSFATLIAYRMNLRGPAITVQTACSTSLVTIDRAYKDLLFGDCDIALAGGAAVTLLDEMGYIHQEGMVLSKDGHCRAFEKKATGTVTGNGVGLVVLKRLKNALADGDHIYSIIKSTAVNNDGNRKAGYSAPSAEGQAAVIQKAIQRSGVGSEQIHYIEAHGTGTVLGDPVEIEGLKRAFNTTKKNYCGLGSVKTNIGHLEAAAGIAGLMKTSMSLQKRMIPASLHCDEINAHIVLEDSPFYVNTRLLDLRNEDNYPLRAGVSSFGQGGSNAHVILEEAPQVDSGPAQRRYQIMTLSAKTELALNNLKGKVRESFRRSPGVHLADAAYTLKVGRKSFAHRSAFLCTEAKEAIDILTAKDTAKRWEAVVPEQAPSVVFMFSGQGAEYVNMALDLYRHEPVFRDKLNECLTVLQEISGLRYQDFLYPDGREQQAEHQIHRQSVSQPLHFALEYSLAWLLINWQVEPLSMIGYSIGEYVAACLAGVFSLRDALFLTYHRGVLMEKLPEGLMITVPLQEEDLLQILPPALSIAAVNDESCIVSGSKDSIAAFEALLKSKKLISMRLQISHAGHSQMLDSMISEFRECVQRVTCNPPAVPFVSSLTGDVITPEEAASPEHWVRHLREPVRFAEGFKRLAPQENTLFIEIGPGRNLCTLVQRFMQPDRNQKLLDTIRVERKKTADDEYLLRTVAQLWVNGVSVDWGRFYSNEQRRRVPLPGYPFEKKRYWLRDFRYGTGSPAIEAGAGQVPYSLPEAPAESEASPVQAEPKPMSSDAAILVQIVTDIIGGTNIGEDDDLFERGFDSLKVISFISKVADAFRVHLTMHEVFQNPTVRELLPVIQRQAPGHAVTIPKAPEAESYPVSSQQKRLYALQQFDEDSTAYNIPGAFVLHGKLDRERVQAACDGLIRRHEALRTSFELIGQALVQKVDPDSTLAIEYCDLPGAGVKETLQGFVQPFRLEQAPLIRIRLVRVENESHVLQIDMHHIISDGLSIELLIRDFLAYYEGRTLAEPRIQYKDYAVWQQNRDSAFWQEERAFWLKQFKDGYELLNLPTDFRRPPVKQFAGSLRPFTWTEEISGPLQVFCQTHQITPYMLLLSCFTILLSKYSGQQEILVGTPVGGRLGVDTEDTVGAFVNTLALRSRPDGAKVVLDYLQEVREDCLHAFDHQGYPFEELVQDVEKERDVSRNPLFDTMFAWEQRDRSQLHISGLQVQRYDFHSGIAKFDLMLQAWEEQGEMGFNIEYATALFKDSTIQRMGSHYQQIVRQVLQSPGRTIRELSLLGPEEAEQVQYGFNQTEAGYDLSQSIIALIEEQAGKRGDETAVVWEGQRLTYRELNERANQVARLLRDRGCQRDEIIGILAERSLAMIIGLLGIEKAGCAYLPLDPDYPAERIGYLIADSGLKLVVTQTAFADQAAALGVTAVDVEEETVYAGYERDNVALDILPYHLAYILYTSGSTGKPKGVMLTHGGLVNRLRWMAEAYGMDEREVVLQKTTYTFDVSVWELFLPLMIGGVLCLAKPGGEKDPDYLVQLINEQGITTLHFVPSMLSGFVHALPENASLGQLRRCICSGEELTPEVKDRFFRRVEGVELHNLYGPTEASIDVTSYEVHPSDTLIPIGKPVSNTRLYIVSEQGGLVPVGIPGELCIGGVQLAKGYLNRPELTAEKFKALPGLPEERLYFTGDLARWREDGNIEYLGRKDTQIKLRGYRIELGEIESAIQKYDSRIETAAVVSQGAQAETKVLCGYFTARERIETEALKEYLRRELPAYMVPVFYMQLDTLPHTSSGKVDRKALAEAAVDHSSKGPVTEVISSKEGLMLENIFKETLGCGNISPSGNFFELGGNSLAAIVLKARISEAFHIHVTILDIFENPTVRELLPVIQRQAPGHAVTIPKAPEAESYPVSSQQKRLYALQQFDEDSTAYNIPGAFVLHGRLDRERVQAACDGLIRRHEALRTSFELIGQALVQKVDPDSTLAIEYCDLPGAGVEETLQGFVQPFRLEQAPLIRIRLVRVENESHVLQIDMHHIISDGLSIELLVRDFLAYYEGRTLAEPRIQYKDYAVWQQNRDSAFWQEERAFWLEQYKDGYELLNLPTDFRRPPVKQFAGSLRPFVWTGEISGPLQAFCQTHQITPYMLLLSCFTILLAKYSGQQEVLVGTPVGGRLGVDTEDTVGVFVNTLALRSRPDGTKVVLDYLQEVREDCLHAFDHQGYPFEELVQDVEKERDVSRNPLFDTMFAWEQRDRSQLHISGLQVQRYDFHSGIAKFDLMLQAWEEQGEMGFNIEYATALFKDSTIQRMGGHYQQIVKQVLQSPGRTIRELSLLGPEEAEQVQYGFNQTEAGYDLSQSIIALIEEQAGKRGDETAVVWEGQRLTYRELNERANQVARLLRDRGCQRDEIIGILAERSLAMIIGLLGIEKAGCAYLPLDPDYPAERIGYLIADSGLKLVVTQTAFAAQAAALGITAVDVEEETVYAGYERDNVALDILPHHLAYVLYTSGSTGKPKGVMLTHGGLVNRLRWMAEAYGMDEQEVVLQKTTYTFDVSVWELFLPLMIGGVLCLAKPGGEKDPDYLVQLINEQGITTLHFVPSMLSGFVHALPENASLGQLRRCICSGEELTPEVKDRFFRRVEGVELHNLYGPTEASIDVTSYEVHPSDTLIPIGKPVSNTRLYIVSEEGGLVPVGIPGELCIGGVQLAKGYLNRPELTAEKFKTLPGLPEERLYFTGDLARWREDGNIEYLGRKDTQIKLRGYRIELGEIESAIQKYDSRIETAAVVSQGAQAETKVLCGYFTARERIETEALKEYLSRELPAYMVPVFYMQLDTLPHTSSGKVDRKTLSQMEIRVEKVRFVHPKTMLEKQMSQLWKEVLHIDKVGLRDDFFQIGGDSLSVIILHQQVKQQVDAEISIANLYRYRTIEAFLDYLSQKQNTPARHTASNAGRRELLLQGNEKRAQRLSKRKGINRDE